MLTTATQANDLEAPQAGAEAIGTSAYETAVLVVKRGPNAGSRYALDGNAITVGRSPDSDIFLDDVTVSRRHVSFVPSGASYQVRDEGSLNGTYLNAELIESALLTNGDEVQIGRFHLVFLSSFSS